MRVNSKGGRQGRDNVQKVDCLSKNARRGMRAKASSSKFVYSSVGIGFSEIAWGTLEELLSGDFWLRVVHGIRVPRLVTMSL
jgi:hypothetical protein